MFTWLGTKLTAILSTYVFGVVSALMTAIAPIALTAMTLWVLLYGWAVLRNEVSETVPNFLWKVTKIGLILALALQSGVYITNVADTVNSLSTGVATTFVPAGAPANTVTTPYQLIDEFNDSASNQVGDIMKEASITRPDLLLAAGVFSLGSVAFLCIAVFVVTLATVFLNFVVAVGPLFIFCLAWKPTQRFFDSWLSMLLNSVVLTWFAFFALGLSTFLGREMFIGIQNAGGFLGPTLNALGEASRYCVLMLVMAIICFQAPSLASALTGGAAIQQGIQMIQSAMMVSSLRSSSGRSAAAGSGGGTMRSGAGIPHAAGYAVGAAGGLARQGYGQARVAAYKLAALRGRS
ncbi:type IV secretion system protein [Paucibacter sp. B2R-40]|uniref:type IV secretion system protein n=1 Tax=Paucibacter sp. B2R-40 TaxID=2893554 RepID=UPI0021E43649|nr:type IV secretion system protein [Paucibacter sp. B2R-40]MCV2354017.1 type IV secretion system protein [Paucibacter sp. B2R-40]